jgi:hypothetical protein
MKLDRMQMLGAAGLLAISLALGMQTASGQNQKAPGLLQPASAVFDRCPEGTQTAVLPLEPVGALAVVLM